MAQKIPQLPQVAPSRLVNTSQVIQRGPSIVLAITVAADGAPGEADIYDGVNDSGEHKAKIVALNGTTFAWTPATGTDFDHGLYVKVNAPTTYVMIEFIPESYKKYV